MPVSSHLAATWLSPLTAYPNSVVYCSRDVDDAPQPSHRKPSHRSLWAFSKVRDKGSNTKRDRS